MQPMTPDEDAVYYEIIRRNYSIPDWYEHLLDVECRMTPNRVIIAVNNLVDKGYIYGLYQTKKGSDVYVEVTTFPEGIPLSAALEM